MDLVSGKTGLDSNIVNLANTGWCEKGKKLEIGTVLPAATTAHGASWGWSRCDYGAVGISGTVLYNTVLQYIIQ